MTLNPHPTANNLFRCACRKQSTDNDDDGNCRQVGRNFSIQAFSIGTFLAIHFEFRSVQVIVIYFSVDLTFDQLARTQCS